MLDLAIAVALVWALYLVVAAHRSRPRHVWGELNSAQIVRMRRRPDRR